MELIRSQIVTTIIGFVLAVLILRRYAWGPILRLLEERREKIQGEFDRIEVEKQAAAALKAEYEAQLRTIEVQARARLQEAVQEGQKVAAEIKEQARQDAHAQLVRAREEIERERDKAQVTLRNDVVNMVVRASENLISERLDDPLHRKLVADFIASLDTLEAKGGTAH
jgi:F-type H+-transporting ATPase subunit b